MDENNNCSKSSYWNKSAAVLKTKKLFKSIGPFKAHNMCLSCHAWTEVFSDTAFWGMLLSSSGNGNDYVNIVFQIYQICYY